MKKLAADILSQEHKRLYSRVGRFFAALMVVQWAGGVVLALMVSPYTWIGVEHRVHQHVIAAVVLGGLLAALPCALALTAPTAVLTRHVVGAAQVMFSALLIHLTGGRIETHFHVFGSLAFLAFYRDWRVLVTATVLVAFDHWWRGTFWPQSVFGVVGSGDWRWIEHTAWVLFEDVVLVSWCVMGDREIRSAAWTRAALEKSRDVVEREVHDRTAELSAALSELGQSQARLNALLDNAPAVIYTKDLDGRYTMVNRCFEALVRMTKQQMLGKTDAELLEPAMAAACRESDLKIMRSGESEIIEENVPTPNGPMTFLSVKCLVRDPAGLPIGVCGISNDITDRKQMETQLREARDLADAANRAKSEFLANMSHEIRTPMTAIIGYADLLQDPSQRPEEKLECVRVIRRNGEHLLCLINDVLDISKIEAGKMSVESIECSPVQIAEEVFSLMQVRALGKNLKLRVEYDFPLPRFASDPLRLRQVLMNLVGNAIKFTEQGEVVLRVGSQPADAGALVRFEVIDTGIGMSEEALARVFQAFTQADASTTRRFGGTGLGLMISRRLVTMMGGELTLASTPEKGTTATVTLRVQAVGDLIESAEPPPAPRPRTTETMEGPRALPPLSARILLAEDGPDNQRLISHHLRKAGAQVVIAENGRAAVDRAIASLKESAPFDLILLDMQMPNMDGYTATSLLRHKGWSGPVLALTAHAMSGDRERCIQAGCNDYMTKPIDRADLIMTCARWTPAARTAAV